LYSPTGGGAAQQVALAEGFHGALRARRVVIVRETESLRLPGVKMVLGHLEGLQPVGHQLQRGNDLLLRLVTVYVTQEQPVLGVAVQFEFETKTLNQFFTL
jgi:hypothetical protein